MDKCYLCGKEFNDTTVLKHDEHIIQQAVGGSFTANNILCSSCGGTLGNNIDAPFTKIFDGIATRLDIKKDRKGNNQNTKSVLGKLGDIEVVWKDFKVSPGKPFHLYTIDKKTVTIYANKRTAKSYQKKIKREIKANFTKNEEPEIIICDDLIGIIEFPFEMNNEDFKKGLAKIAIGFASKHDIKREDLPLVMNIDNDTGQAAIKNKIIAIPFYPLGIIDRLIEIQKNEFEHFPFHNLILFTLDYDPKISEGKKVLVCYVELFSTFQWYIVLNDEYTGNSIYEYHAQQILKKEDFTVELGRRYYRERNLWLQPLGITEENIDKKYRDQKNKFFSKIIWSTEPNVSNLNPQLNLFKNIKSRYEIEKGMIVEETIKQKYKFDFESYIKNIIDGIINQVHIWRQKEALKKQIPEGSYFHKFLNDNRLLSEYDRLFQSFEGNSNFINNLSLFFRLDSEDTEFFYIHSYRVLFCENQQLKNYYDELINFSKDEFTKLKRYHHEKMYMLEEYIQEENTKKKSNKT